ncbi:rod-binding protein [Acuticoccus sp.]|uniref:rod-binding protein n=1 Tax=Acuticoccus sp. TaxID=1904378 RepID=UPI003B5245C5
MTSVPPIAATERARIAPTPSLPRSPSAAEPFAVAMRGTGSAAEARVAASQDVGRAFEAVTLGTFVSEMLPSDTSSFWGSDGGKLWRGVFAEHLAAEIAETGGVGIADLVNEMLDEREGPAA